MKGASFSEKKRKLSWDEKSHNIYFNKFSIVVCSFFLFNFLFRGRLWRRLLPWRRTLLQQGPLTWWYMKNILNFFLSVIGGYIICLVLYLVFLMILLNFWTPPSSHFLMFFLSSLSFYTLSLLFFVCLVPWGLFSFLWYKFFKRTLLK